VPLPAAARDRPDRVRLGVPYVAWPLTLSARHEAARLSTLNLCGSFHSRGGGLGRPQAKRPIASGRCSCGDLWNVNWQPHRSLPEEFRQSPSPGRSPLRRKLRGVAFRVFGLVPQTDAKCFLSSRCDKCDFVQESLLFSKQGNDSLSRVWVKSGTLPFRCMETLRANMDSPCSRCQGRFR